jgi:medium-chain acyl-[acyl-carrier-protein] hydrolase
MNCSRTPAIVTGHPEMRAMLSPVPRADFELAETCRYQDMRPLDCPVTVFGGIHALVVSPDELAAWREHATGASGTPVLDGGHYLIDSARDELLRAIVRGCG